MEDKQTRLLMWLGTMMLVLVAVILLLKPSEDKGDDDSGAKDSGADFAKVFTDVDAATVQSLTITHGEATATIERTEGGWKMTAPTEIEADSRRVDALLDSLLNLEAQPAMEGAQSAQFGLEPPKVQVQATLDDDRKLTLDIGADTPVGAGTYVRDSTGIRASRARLSYTFDKDPTELRTRELVRFAASEVDRVEIAAPDGSLVDLLRDDHGWWVGGGHVLRADDESVRGLLDALLDLRVETFSEGPVALPVDATRVIVHVGEAHYELDIGAADEGMALVVGPVQPGPALVRLPESGLTRPAANWASTRLLPVHIDTVDSMELVLGGAPWTARRTDAGWEPPEGRALLDAVGDVRVDRTTLAATPEAEWGRLTLAEGDTRKETVHFFQEAPGGGRVALDDAGGQPFVVPATELKRLEQALVPAP